jgi:hypothetical protein
MLNLMLHCGSRKVAREQVECSLTPERTRTWTPIGHHRLLEQVEDSLTGVGVRIVNEAHALSADHNRYFGLLEVVNGRQHGDCGLVLGLRNSHDKSFPAALVVGTGVFVCDNLSFSGEIKIARRHTRFIERDLPGLVQLAVGRLGDLRGLQDQRIAKYKATRLSNMRAHHLIVKALEARVIPATAVPTAVAEWRRPSHSEFTEGGRTAWRLFNSLTESLKGRSLDALPRRTQMLHGMLDTVCGGADMRKAR